MGLAAFRRQTVAFILVGLFSAVLSSTVLRPSSAEAEEMQDEALPQGGTVFDVLTQHNNSQRTGTSLHETILTPESVQKGSFDRLFDWEVDGQIYTQPLYVSHLPYPDKVVNVVILATMNNSVYAFEAPAADTDVRPSELPLWHVDKSILGTPLPYDYFSMAWGILGHNIEPLIGIAATPVIDRQRNTVYVTAKSGSDDPVDGVHYRLFAIDLLTGKVKHEAEIVASYEGRDGAKATLNSTFHFQRASLLEENDRIYVAFGSHQDTVPYHGWILAYDADDLKQVAAYCTTCAHVNGDQCRARSSCMGGIWQGGGGPAADREGNIYVMTGNGTFDKTSGDLGTSFIKLDKDLNVLGSWTPVTYKCLNRTDSDLGSAGPIFMLDSSILVGGGKEGLLYAIKPEALQGTNVGTGKPVGAIKPRLCDARDPTPDMSGQAYWSIQASPPWERTIMDLLRLVEPTVVSQGLHHIHGSPVLWNVDDSRGDRSLLYISAERDVLRAYEFNSGFVKGSRPGDKPLDTFHSRCRNSTRGMPGGFLTVSASGSASDSGIVWAAMPRLDKDALHHVVPGILRAYKAYPDQGVEMVEIWNSDNGANISRSSCKESLVPRTAEMGLFAKFVPPTVAEGKVYMATFSGRLVVYGLKNVTATALRTNSGHDATLKTRALPTTVEPGGIIAISIAAKNSGAAIWRVSDGIKLSSQMIPKFTTSELEGEDSLVLQSDVFPGKTSTFHFRVTAPKDEGTYYYSWRLIREGKDAKQGSGDWFGSPTQEWVFKVLRSECADLRKKADRLITQIHPGSSIPPLTVNEIVKVRRSAEKRHCALTVDHAEHPTGAH